MPPVASFLQSLQFVFKISSSDSSATANEMVPPCSSDPAKLTFFRANAL